MLLDSCNKECYCETNFYEPVCSQEAGIFFSPCFAGCTMKDGNQVSVFFFFLTFIFSKETSYDSTD